MMLKLTVVFITYQVIVATFLLTGGVASQEIIQSFKSRRTQNPRALATAVVSLICTGIIIRLANAQMPGLGHAVLAFTGFLVCLPPFVWFLWRWICREYILEYEYDGAWMPFIGVDLTEETWALFDKTTLSRTSGGLTLWKAYKKMGKPEKFMILDDGWKHCRGRIQ